MTDHITEQAAHPHLLVGHSFHSGLFEAAITAEARVWPVAFRYQRPDRTTDVDAAFIGANR